KEISIGGIPLQHAGERAKHWAIPKAAIPFWALRETRGKTTMKKALFATTALVLSAGIAAADVTISGYGRTGIIYYDVDQFNDNGDELSKTRVSSRLRLNIDASTTTDSGIDFGARMRLQWNQGESDTVGNPAKLYVTTNGLTVEVGNVDT